MKNSNKKLEMKEVSSGYETFIKGKKLNNNRSLFEVVVKKAVKYTKQRGSK